MKNYRRAYARQQDCTQSVNQHNGNKRSAKMKEKKITFRGREKKRMNSQGEEKCISSYDADLRSSLEGEGEGEGGSGWRIVQFGATDRVKMNDHRSVIVDFCMTRDKRSLDNLLAFIDNNQQADCLCRYYPLSWCHKIQISSRSMLLLILSCVSSLPSNRHALHPIQNPNLIQSSSRAIECFWASV